MKDQIKEFLGEGPYPFPLEETKKFLDTYLTAKSVIVATKNSIDFPEANSHAHSSYEFLIPLSAMPLAWAGKRKVEVEVNQLMPFNSGQDHGPAQPYQGCKLLSFQINQQQLHETAFAMFGKSDVVFRNENSRLERDMQELFRVFIEETQNKQAGYQFIAESISIQITVNLLRQLRSNLPVMAIERNYSEHKNIKRAIEFMLEHYNSQFNLDDLASLTNFSPYHFIRLFKAQTGKTPYKYLLDIKIQKAKSLLKKSNHTITEICYLCGFNSINYFSTIFKREIGVSPSEYRKHC